MHITSACTLTRGRTLKSRNFVHLSKFKLLVTFCALDAHGHVRQALELKKHRNKMKINLLQKPKISSVQPYIQTGELRKRVKIVVIDDEESSFPFKLLQDDGYTIEWWEKVDSRKLQRLESGDFDIIILDIQGVADTSISSTDGIGVLKRVKSVNPCQIVVAFSGHSYDLSKTEFWKLADDALTKPVTIIKCKELLDRLIEENITLTNYWKAINKFMLDSGVNHKTINKVERIIAQSLKNNNKYDPDEIVSKFMGGVQNTAAILTLLQAIVRLFV